MERGCSLRCYLCDTVLRNNDQSRSNHMRNFWKSSDDPTRCDNVQISLNRRIVTVPLITMPVEVDPVVSMARRRPSTWHREREVRSRYAVKQCEVSTVDARDLTLIQNRWDEKLTELSHLNDGKFWRLFLAMYTLSGTAIDSALNVVKKCSCPRLTQSDFP